MLRGYTDLMKLEESVPQIFYYGGENLEKIAELNGNVSAYSVYEKRFKNFGFCDTFLSNIRKHGHVS